MISYRNLGKAGRLGNQCFQIAATCGLAETHGTEPRFNDWDYRPFFDIGRSACDPWFVSGPKPRGLEEITTPATDLVPHMDDRAKPYLQDYNLFAGIDERVRALLSVSADGLGEMYDDDRYDDFFAERAAADRHGRALSSLHIRRGDNVTHPPGLHPLVTPAYYEAAADLLPNGTIVVFSDDIPWCRRELPKIVPGRDFLYVEGDTRVPDYGFGYAQSLPNDWKDLQAQALCDHHVIANSTYSWWGAFLSMDPEPIYPLTWFGAKITAFTDWKLMIPSAWRGVDNPVDQIHLRP